MRTLLVPLVICLAFLAPTGSAHMGHCEGSEDELCHISVTVQDLAPGQEHTYKLHSERVGGDFPEGWIVTAFGGIQGNGAVIVNLTTGNETLQQWTWTAGGFHSNSTRIERTGHYELRLRNTGAETVRYGFYYDQSCNCAYKVIPLPGGFVLFNYDLPAGRDVSVGFPTIEGWHVRAKLAKLTNDSGEWPRDYDVLWTAEQKNKGWLYLNFTSGFQGTHYVFVEALEGVATNPDGSPRPVELTPLLVVSEEKTPTPTILVVAAFALVALLIGRRRRA